MQSRPAHDCGISTLVITDGVRQWESMKLWLPQHVSGLSSYSSVDFPSSSQAKLQLCPTVTIMLASEKGDALRAYNTPFELADLLF
jgi:hypothetical protein